MQLPRLAKFVCLSEVQAEIQVFFKSWWTLHFFLGKYVSPESHIFSDCLINLGSLSHLFYPGSLACFPKKSYLFQFILGYCVYSRNLDNLWISVSRDLHAFTASLTCFWRESHLIIRRVSGVCPGKHVPYQKCLTCMCFTRKPYMYMFIWYLLDLMLYTKSNHAHYFKSACTFDILSVAWPPWNQIIMFSAYTL